MEITYFHVDEGLVEEIERNAKLNHIRLWAKVRHIGPLLYFDENGEPYEEIVTKESITDPEFVNKMMFLPVTDEHPPEFVNSRNLRKYMRGMTGTQPAVDEDGFLIDFAIFDENLIQKIEAGKRDVSLGYLSTVRIDSDGKRYQVKCEPNHLAIVDKGRAPKARILYSVRGDSIAWEKKSMKKVTINGKNFEVDAELAEELDKYGKNCLDATSKYDQLKAEYDALKAEYDALKAKMDQAKERADRLERQVEEMQKQRVDASQVEKEILARYEVIDAARRLNLRKTYSPTQASLELKRQVIGELRPKLNLDGKSEEYICAAYDSIIDLMLEEMRQKEEEEMLVIQEEEEQENTNKSFYRAWSQKSDAKTSQVDRIYAEYKTSLENSYYSDFRK